MARLVEDDERSLSQITPQLAEKLKCQAWCLERVLKFLPWRERGTLAVRPADDNVLSSDHYWIHTPSARFPSLTDAFAHIRHLRKSHAQSVAAGFDASEERSVVAFCHSKVESGSAQAYHAQAYHAGRFRISDADLQEYKSMLHRGSATSLNFAVGV